LLNSTLSTTPPTKLTSSVEERISEFGIDVVCAPDCLGVVKPVCLYAITIAVEFAAGRELRRSMPRADELHEQSDGEGGDIAATTRTAMGSGAFASEKMASRPTSPAFLGPRTSCGNMLRQWRA
jgi:hypothetical protein